MPCNKHRLSQWYIDRRPSFGEKTESRNCKNQNCNFKETRLVPYFQASKSSLRVTMDYYGVTRGKSMHEVIIEAANRGQ